jgi:hypothetical protein
MGTTTSGSVRFFIMLYGISLHFEVTRLGAVSSWWLHPTMRIHILLYACGPFFFFACFLAIYLCIY